MEKKNMSIEEAAEYSGLSKYTLYKRSANGTIPMFKVGTRVLIPREEFDQWLEQHRRGPSGNGGE